MAAGGFRTFVAGETLDEEKINDFLMQGILVFDDATARDAAITAPVEGQFAFRKDDDVVEFYDGTGWVELAAAGPSATGGDESKTVGDFTYHLFTTGGTLTVVDPGAFEVLVVGGGAGGGAGGAGGGAGAVESFFFNRQHLSAGTYSVTIGTGGAGSTNANVRGANGGNSSFAGIPTFTSLGGGGGASGGANTGLTGGSGGGGWNSNAGGGASGSNTTPGEAGPFSPARGGGGGGASAQGSGQTGGEGLALATIDSNLTSGNFTSFSGMTVISSGGGGGSTDGVTGAGGTGAGTGSNSSSVAGTAGVSYGSGGGGGGVTGGVNANGGNGKAGIVIVRYAA